MKLIQIPIFTYDELPKEIQEKIINDAIQFMIEVYDDPEEWSPNFALACKKADDMRTPWFVGEYIWELCKEEVLTLCREVLYFRNGKIYSENYQ